MPGTSEKIDKLQERLDESGFPGKITRDVPMAPMTWYKVGGNASVLIEADNIENLIDLKLILDELSMPWMLIGGGANLLVSDDGFEGAIVKLGGTFSEMQVDVDNTKIWCGSAVPLLNLVREGSQIGMTGIERLAGIPGSAGGAIYMNAGTFGEFIGDLIDSVDILASDNTVQTLGGDECEFTYRTSRFQESDEIILGCLVISDRGNPGEITAEIEKRITRRKETQPIEIPSCGCVFRNPEGEKSAGFLIQEAGLMGTTEGGAVISDKHANFIVNTGNASASDILHLMALARVTVREKYGVTLKPEVELVGCDDSLEVLLDAWNKKEKT